MLLKTFLYYCFIVSVLYFLTSCSATKTVPANDALYMGARIRVSGPKLTSKKKKELVAELRAMTRPRPNGRFLGIPFKLLIYNTFHKIKFLRNMGEPPVLLSSVNVDHNVKVLDNDLENNGYFHAEVAGDTVVRKRKAFARYKAQTGVQYTIREIHFENDTSALTQAILKTTSKSLLKPGKPFDLDIIKAERIRIDANLKENGYYFFNPDFLIIQVDSTIGDNQVNMYVKVKPGLPEQTRNVYTINDVYIYSNFNLATAAIDTNQAHATFYKGYYVVDVEKIYKPRLFQEAMQFKPGEKYNRTDHNQTINRLMNLNLFKFVKNRFEEAEGLVTPQLNVFYYLTPYPKKSLRAEFTGNTKSNNQTGSMVSLSWRNRNTFRGGELFTFKVFAGSEVQYSGQFKGYNSFRGGGEINFSMPRFLIPFSSIPIKGGFTPKTNITVGYDFLTKQQLYTLNSFRMQYGYIWKKNLRSEQEFNPISIQYVVPFRISQIYRDTMAKYPTLRKAVDTQFIIGSNYSYTYNELLIRQPVNGFYFTQVVDLSGNIAGLVTGANAKTGEQKRLFQAPFSQYIKSETEFRFYRKLSESTVWASRVIVGLGYPWGNSQELPYIKQFFIGGNNSIRAFRSRSIGPGRYVPVPPRSGKNYFIPDQSGDIKLELNTEYRPKLANMIYGAVFVDAGNIWLFNENPEKPGANFTGNFLSELAVGTGVGIRFDINILVLRLDVAIPLRLPTLPKGERWVVNGLQLHDREWRRENVIFNLAIGYPF